MISWLGVDLYIDGAGAGGQPECIVKLVRAVDVLGRLVTFIFRTGAYNG